MVSKGLGLSFSILILMIPLFEANRAFGLSSSFDYSSSLHALEDPNRESSLGVRIMQSLKVNERWVVSGDLAVNQDLFGEQEFSISRSRLGIKEKGWDLNPVLHLNPSARLNLPLYKDARSRESLILGTGASIKLGADFSKAKLKLAYEPSFTRNLHEFDTSTAGVSNIAWGINHALSENWEFAKGVSAFADFIRTQGFTYSGEQKDGFAWDEGVEVDLGHGFANASLGLTHTNEARALKANGTDSNISPFSGETSRYSVTLSLDL